MNLDNINWDSLERLRTAFLTGTAGANDYWQSEADLASYDATFAQRIGWKWDFVLMELQRRGWSPPHGELLDWGCGSGIASRAFLDLFGPDSVASLRLADRSSLAVQFATRRAAEKYPGLKIQAGLGDDSRAMTPLPVSGHPPHEPGSSGRESAPSEFGVKLEPTHVGCYGSGVQGAKHHSANSLPIGWGEGRVEGHTAILLLSHVLTELNQAQTEELVSLAAGATTVLWVEPGTYEVSYTLVAIREKLREVFNVFAPCTHQAHCGLLTAGNERHWCHHFAPPPPEIFQDSGWSRFASLTGIDLRDLPLSFLVLDKRPVPVLPAGAARVIGHPRLYKPHALLLGCDESGVRDRKLTKRALPAEYKRLKKECDSLQVWESEDDEIVRITRLP